MYISIRSRRKKGFFFFFQAWSNCPIHGADLFPWSDSHPLPYERLSSPSWVLLKDPVKLGERAPQITLVAITEKKKYAELIFMWFRIRSSRSILLHLLN
jgi:hypothetical protein